MCGTWSDPTPHLVWPEVQDAGRPRQRGDVGHHPLVHRAQESLAGARAVMLAAEPPLISTPAASAG